jgi:hypothetical protein
MGQNRIDFEIFRRLLVSSYTVIEMHGIVN